MSLQRLDDALWHRHRPITVHDDIDYPKSAVDATPAITRQVQTDEQIAGEKGCINGLQFAGMAHGLQVAWQKDRIGLGLELRARTKFTPRQSMNQVPTSSALGVTLVGRPQTTLGKASAPRRFCVL